MKRRRLILQSMICWRVSCNAIPATHDSFSISSYRVSFRRKSKKVDGVKEDTKGASGKSTPKEDKVR